MKIAWYTPFSVQSAIGRYSALVVEELAQRGVDVTVVRSEAPTKGMRQIEPITTSVPVCWAQEWGSNPAQVAADYDLVIYNIGDHYTYHEYCFRHMEVIPGIGILHDFVLHNALNGYCHARNEAGFGYDAVLEEECGQDVLNTMRELVQGDPKQWWQQEIVNHPVLRWILRHALGVVVHSKFTEVHLRSRVACPTAMIPLAYDGCGEYCPPPASDSKSRMRLLTVGHVNPNKRVKEVVEVLAAHESLRDRCEYRVVGPIEDEQKSEIMAAVEKGGRGMQVTLRGRVETRDLRQEFQQADVVICLRNPAMEGGSASVVEGLLTGKPVVVSNTGCFAEIPDGYVFKVDVRYEKQHLKQVLHSIIDDYGAALQRAEAARQWAMKRHAPASYGAQFMEFCERILYDQPLLRTVDRVSNCLRMWNTPGNPALFERLDLAMGDLFRDGRRARRIA